MRQSRLTIIVPVYNEGANFRALWKQLTSSVSMPFTALVIYDFDQDDTVPVVQEIVSGGDQRLRLVKNSICRGVVGAIRTGFEEAPEGAVLVVMADLSDDLSRVPEMMRLYEQGYDLVAGSRYMKGGRTLGGPWLKQNLSRLAGLSLRWLRGIPTRDATNAFKLYDRRMLRSFCIESRAGFELNLELTVKAFLAGYPMTEVPTTWRDRTAGESRFRLWSWLPHYLKWYLYAFRPRTVAGSQRRSAPESSPLL
jgi:dolichol-phosphate mannosyltransferase